MDAGIEIASAISRINQEQKQEEMRQLYRASMKVLKQIPSGTPDSELTDKQRQAWADHDRAIRWVEARL